MDVKKVRFAAKPTIHIIECDSARDGSIWMQFARDRARFQRRIEILRPILEPVLQRHVNMSETVSQNASALCHLTPQTKF